MNSSQQFRERVQNLVNDHIPFELQLISSSGAKVMMVYNVSPQVEDEGSGVLAAIDARINKYQRVELQHLDIRRDPKRWEYFQLQPTEASNA